MRKGLKLSFKLWPLHNTTGQYEASLNSQSNSGHCITPKWQCETSLNSQSNSGHCSTPKGMWNELELPIKFWPLHYTNGRCETCLNSQSNSSDYITREGNVKRAWGPDQIPAIALQPRAMWNELKLPIKSRPMQYNQRQYETTSPAKVVFILVFCCCP